MTQQHREKFVATERSVLSFSTDHLPSSDLDLLYKRFWNPETNPTDDFESWPMFISAMEVGSIDPGAIDISAIILVPSIHPKYPDRSIVDGAIESFREEGFSKTFIHVFEQAVMLNVYYLILGPLQDTYDNLPTYRVCGEGYIPSRVGG